MKDYYDVLGVPRNASNDLIKSSYRKAALFWHPDKNSNSNAHDRFLEISEAYSILINSKKRQVYDELYDKIFLKQYDIAIIKNTSTEYKIYEEWVINERVKAEKEINISSDEILTDTFHFLDKYGLLIMMIIVVVVVTIIFLSTQ